MRGSPRLRAASQVKKAAPMGPRPRKTSESQSASGRRCSCRTPAPTPKVASESSPDTRQKAPTAAVERQIKGFLFDCRMCGQCILSSTGLSCPMNCPKGLRNGPCGGVRPDGHCEVVPEMRCVWVEAFEGSRRLRTGDAILEVQRPVDHRLWGRSAWLNVLRTRAGERTVGPDTSAAPPSATPRPAAHKRAA